MPPTSNWLHVMINGEQAKVSTLPSLITLSDVKCDNYVRLLAADIYGIDGEILSQTKLKVFRGIDLESEHILMGVPTAIESFYIDEIEPKTPILAVAIAESILFYRNLKPYFKYTLPELPILQEERNVWQKLNIVREEDQTLLIDALNALERCKLCWKSQRLLQLPFNERNLFISEQIDTPLQRHANVVAMKCLARVSSGQNQVPSNLVIATDIGEIFILEAQSFSILYKSIIYPEMPPSILAVHGTFETDFCIILATRYGSVYLLRKNTTEPQEIFKLSQPPVSLVLLPVDQTIIVATMDKRLMCYSKKGKQLYMIHLPEQPICMTSINLSHFGITIICVALANGLIQFYMQKYLVDAFTVTGTVTSLIFGRMGWEEYVLVLCTLEGDLILKILKRTATFEPLSNLKSNNLLLNNINKSEDLISAAALDKPKKCSIFVEQIARETENAKTAYRNFQIELWRLRYMAASATLDALKSSETTISNDITSAPVQLSAEVCGVGPIFRIYITLQNLSTYKMAANLMVLLHADRRHYTIQKSLAKLPCIFPGIPLKIDFEIIAVFDPKDKLPPHTLTSDNSHVRVFLLKEEQAKPLIATNVGMPQSQLKPF